MTCPSHHPRTPWVACESTRAVHDVHVGRAGSVWVSWPDDDRDADADGPSRADAVRARHAADQARWAADTRIT